MTSSWYGNNALKAAETYRWVIQKIRNSIPNALELRFSRIIPSIWCCFGTKYTRHHLKETHARGRKRHTTGEQRTQWMVTYMWYHLAFGIKAYKVTKYVILVWNNTLTATEMWYYLGATPKKDLSDFSASIVLNAISDHFPCVVNFKILHRKQLPPKYVNTRKISDEAIKDFRDDLLKINISSHLNSNLMINPNLEYEKFDDIIQNFYQKHFPEKREKFHKYKHRISNWMTSGIIKSIEFRDNLYEKMENVSAW